MNTLPFPNDINIISYLPLLESKKLKTLAHVSLKYVYHNHFNVQINAANVIKKFLKYSHNLFICSNNLNSELLCDIKNKHSTFFKKFKFLSINLLYMSEYTLQDSKSFIQGLNIEYKENIIKKYITINDKNTVSKYFLNKLLNIMDFNDIFVIGF